MKRILFKTKIFFQSRISFFKIKRVKPGYLSYRCNICGSFCDTMIGELGREISSCPCCASTVRMRAIVHLLSMELFGKSFAIQDFPVKKNIKGIGMSDWEPYAAGLKKKLGYKNTFYHKKPKLDIASIDPSLEGTLDFIISSDVFEHVPPPVSRAFHNLRRLLKPGGVVIFTVPFTKDAKTLEHFPNLHKYEIAKTKEGHVLKNITKDGMEETFGNLVFHGGPGSTLELRVFAEGSLIKEFESSGFKTVRICGVPDFEHGIVWKDDWSLPIVARS